MVSAFAELWSRCDGLELRVEQTAITWDGSAVYESENRLESLAFLLHKDGVRRLQILPGFEQAELDTFLSVLHTAQYQPSEEDDLLTLLWQADFSLVRYTAVSLFAEGLDIPEPADAPPFDVQLVARLAREQVSRPMPGWRETGEPAGADSPRSADPAAYGVEPEDMQRIHQELRLEKERELSRHLLSALLDSLEEPIPDRQSRILRALATLLRALLHRGEVGLAEQALTDLHTIAARDGLLAGTRRTELEAILDQVSGEETVQRLVHGLEAGSLVASPRHLQAFLRRLRPAALPSLLSALQRIENPEARRLLEGTARTIAQRDPRVLLALLRSDDPRVAAGAALLAASLGLPGLAWELAALVHHSDTAVRLAAVRGLSVLGDGDAVPALLRALRDGSRDVRIAAVRALGALRDPACEPGLRQVIQEQGIQEADLTEKIAFFEAYGTLGAPGCVPVLAEILTGRGLLGPKHPPEFRACAALGLGRLRIRAAREALQRAGGDKDPLVRNAVTQALRGSAGA